MTTSKNQDLKKHIQSIMEVIKKNVIQGYKIFIVFPFYVLTHPIDGFYELKEGKKGLYKVATLFFLIHSILSVVEFAYTGFIFNNINPSQFRIFRSIILSVLPYVVFIVANWSITSLMDGKGKFKEIYLVIGYTFFPYITLRIISIFMSNFYSVDEGFFYYGTISFGLGLSLYLIFMGIRSIHEYSVFKTVVTILLTFLSMTVIIFMGLLAINLAQQIILFIQTIIKEITLRL
jgi:hypothetical protein